MVESNTRWTRGRWTWPGAAAEVAGRDTVYQNKIANSVLNLMSSWSILALVVPPDERLLQRGKAFGFSDPGGDLGTSFGCDNWASCYSCYA